MADMSSQFMGLSKKRAQDLAEARNLIFRLIRVDGKSYFDYPADERDDRVCVEIDGDKVTKSTIQ